MTSAPTQYVLGSDDAEIARLDGQAAALEPGTAILLQAAGIRPGMRVLELGTGLGHVALRLSAMVGPEGSVVAVDQAPRLLERAEARRREAGAGNVRFVEGDARTFRDGEPFDAVVARLLMFHLPDAVDVVRRHAAALRPGGVMALIDFDIGTARSDPTIPLVADLRAWIEAAFRGAGANARVGAVLWRILRDAGLPGAATVGVQPYFPPDSPHGPAMLAGVARALTGPIVAMGLATEAELGIETLERRIADELVAHDAVLLMPGLVGAWAAKAAAPPSLR